MALFFMVFGVGQAASGLVVDWVGARNVLLVGLGISCSGMSEYEGSQIVDEPGGSYCYSGLNLHHQRLSAKAALRFRRTPRGHDPGEYQRRLPMAK